MARALVFFLGVTKEGSGVQTLAFLQECTALRYLAVVVSWGGFPGCFFRTEGVGDVQ